MKKYAMVLVAILVLVFLFVSCSTLYPAKVATSAPFEYMQGVGIANKGGISSWSVEYYVDDFQNKTNRAYVTQSDMPIEGSFSNSATNNSPAYSKFLIDRNSVGLALFEYKSLIPVTAITSDRAYIKIQTEDGTVIDLGSFGFTNENKRVWINNPTAVLQLFESFVNSPIVKMRIEIKSSYGTPSIYNFNIPTNGFEEMYHNAFIGDQAD